MITFYWNVTDRFHSVVYILLLGVDNCLFFDLIIFFPKIHIPSQYFKMHEMIYKVLPSLPVNTSPRAFLVSRLAIQLLFCNLSSPLYCTSFELFLKNLFLDSLDSLFLDIVSCFGNAHLFCSFWRMKTRNNGCISQGPCRKDNFGTLKTTKKLFTELWVRLRNQQRLFM